MHVNINDVIGVQISPGVVERVLLRPDQSKPGGLSVKHYILTKGEVVFNEPNVEWQHYIISGHALFSGRIVDGDTTIFKPCSARFDNQEYAELPSHSIVHLGEGETRILTLAYSVPRPNFRWAKSRIKNIHEVGYSRPGRYWGTGLITEEEHAVMGALRMHAVDVQTNNPGVNLPPHKNPEEIMYFLGGEGRAISESIGYDVRAGSFIYTSEGGLHGIDNTHPNLPLHYFVVEFVEHDKMWTERGYIGKDWKPSWEWAGQ